MKKNRPAAIALATIMAVCCMVGSCAAGPMNVIARDGTAALQIVVADDAPETDRNAARALADYLHRITGAEFSIVPLSAMGDGPAVAVGPQVARALAPHLDLSMKSLGQEGIVMHTVGPHLVLTGADGASRGTLYAAYTFLGDVCGVRWWSPGEIHVPNQPSLEIPSLDVRFIPPLEYREIHAVDAFNPEWAVCNRINGNSSDIPQAMGGHVVYADSMFVHTFELLVPHAEHFTAHPEWFSEIDGKRVPPPGRTQLCLANVDLLEFVKEKVRNIAQQIPADADAIISVSQNDNQAFCQCADCRKVAAEEGSESGAMLRFVNAIADDVRQSHPRIAIDTLAYQYTRRPPNRTKPRDNVIVRLCSYECSFAQPYTDPINRAFAEDVRDWAKISRRLYVWDYITNFRYYVHPHPNIGTLAPNVKFFVSNGVKGLFEQGNRHSAGGNFAVLKQWVLAQLLWDPTLDGRKLTETFVSEYYQAAAPAVLAHLALLQKAAGDSFVGISDNHLASYLSPEVLAESYAMLDEAASKVSDDKIVSARVDQVKASILHAIVRGWSERKQLAEMQGSPWPLKKPYAEYLDELSRIIGEQGITVISEGLAEGNLQAWIDSLRTADAPATVPAELKTLKRNNWYDLQENAFILYGEETGKAARVDDLASSNGRAVAMPSDHVEWATQATLNELGGGSGVWTIYAAIRVEKTGDAGDAFSYGIYDDYDKNHPVAAATVPSSHVSGEGYQLYRIGAVELKPTRFVWIAPTASPAVKRILVDRFLFVRGDVHLKTDQTGD